MSVVRVLVVASVLAATGLSACAGYGSAAGDVAMAPEVVANTTVLHVANRYKANMRIYAVMDGKEHYLGTVSANGARNFLMNPNLVGEAGVSFSAREANADESTSLSRGPYLIDKGRVIEFSIDTREVEDLKHLALLPAQPLSATY